MRILLLNTNPVVSRLITLCLKDTHAELYEFSSLEAIEEKAYDLAFIDDAHYAHITLSALKKFNISKLILLTSHPEKKEIPVDIVIKKPFLPSKIIEVIASLHFAENTEASSAEPPHIFPLSAEEETLEDAQKEKAEVARSAPILDIKEIERIKSLLEMDETVPDEMLWEKDEQTLERLKREVIQHNLIDEGLKIVEEEEEVNALQKDVTLHITHDVKQSEEQKEAFETKLLDAIEKMKIKKLKKLLNGAEVAITITFKDSKE